VLLPGELIACTCVALDVDIGQMLSAVLQVVAARSPEQTRRPLRQIIVSAGGNSQSKAGVQLSVPAPTLD
jgi:hypothetical protein